MLDLKRRLEQQQRVGWIEPVRAPAQRVARQCLEIEVRILTAKREAEPALAILVAVALGRSDIGLRDVWQATRRNTWRLALGPFACLVILALPGAITLRLGSMNRMSAAIVLTLLDLISIIGGVIGVSFLSLAYRHFFPGKPRMRVKGTSQFVPAVAH